MNNEWLQRNNSMWNLIAKIADVFSIIAFVGVTFAFATQQWFIVAVISLIIGWIFVAILFWKYNKLNKNNKKLYEESTLLTTNVGNFLIKNDKYTEENINMIKSFVSLINMVLYNHELGTPIETTIFCLKEIKDKMEYYEKSIKNQA